MSKLNKILIVISAISVIAVWLLSVSLNKLSNDNERLKNNQDALMSEVFNYVVKDSLNAASIEVLTLKKNEMKKYIDSIYVINKDLKIRIKDLESYMNLKTETSYDVKVEFKDSIRINYKDSLRIVFDTIKCFEYNSDWLYFSGCKVSNNDSMDVKIINYEEILGIEHIKRRKFLFFRWGEKSRNYEILLFNPNTKIRNIQYIKKYDK